MSIHKIAFRIFIKFLLDNPNFNFNEFHREISEELLLSEKNEEYKQLLVLIKEILTLRDQPNLIVNKIRNFEQKIPKRLHENNQGLFSIPRNPDSKFYYFRGMHSYQIRKETLHLLYLEIFSATHNKHFLSFIELFQIALIVKEEELALKIYIGYGGNKEWFTPAFDINIDIDVSDGSNHLILLECLSKAQDGDFILMQIINHLLNCDSQEKAKIIFKKYLSQIKIDAQKIKELPWSLIEFIYKQGKIAITGDIGVDFLLQAVNSGTADKFSLILDEAEDDVCITKVLLTLLDVNYIKNYLRTKCCETWEGWRDAGISINLLPFTEKFAPCLYYLLDRSDLTLENKQGFNCFALIELLEQHNWHKFEWYGEWKQQISSADAKIIKNIFREIRHYLESNYTKENHVELKRYALHK